MQVEINNSIQVQNLAASVQVKANGDAKPVRPSAESASIKAKYSKVIEKALKGEEIDPVLVEQAKKFLASDGANDPEIAKKAAENLLKYGL